MRVSIHLGTKDRTSELALLLQSLRTQTFKDFDIVICDGSQPKPFWEYCKFLNDMIVRLKCEGHGVQMIRDDGLGVCQARNKMLKEDIFKNPLICRIDDDSIIAHDYLERLYKLLVRGSESVKPSDTEKTGAVSGIVPVFGAPEFKRENKFAKPIFNKIEFDKDGNINFKDDGGFSYMEDEIIPSHHMRSSWMFKREIYDKHGIKFETGLSASGFREETYWSLRVAWAGYKMFTDTGAKAWHLQCPSGGVKSADYAQRVQIDDANFRRWAKRMYEEKGDPFK